MNTLSMSGIIIRFVLGGGAVAGSSIVAGRLGGKFGGIFASFPAVFLAALLTLRLGSYGQTLLNQSLSLSKGALVGMIADIVCAVMAGYLCTRLGWRQGLTYSVGTWLALSCVAVAVTHA